MEATEMKKRQKHRLIITDVCCVLVVQLNGCSSSRCWESLFSNDSHALVHVRRYRERAGTRVSVLRALFVFESILF